VKPLLLLLAAVAAGAENAPDPLGFPVRFDGDTITRRDLLRRLGVEEETLGSEQTLRGARDSVLFSMVNERVGRNLGVQITDEEVQDQIQRRIDELGGEAKFYQSLVQGGISLERYRQFVRTELMTQYIQIMVRHGMAPGGRILPFDISARPSEIETAFRTESASNLGAERVKVQECFVQADPETRQALVQRMFQEGQTADWMEQEIGRLLQAKVEGLYADVAGGKNFEEAAAAHGVPLDPAGPAWKTLPPAGNDDPATAFLRTARPDELSAPEAVQGGGYRFVRLVERVKEEPKRLDDPAVVKELQERIREPRRRKAQALLRLQALDQASVEPERVRTELRQVLLLDLGEAEAALRKLGLH